MQETCVTVTWMNLFYKLLQMTNDVKYADWMERSALNAMGGAVNTEKQKVGGINKRQKIKRTKRKTYQTTYYITKKSTFIRTVI